MISHVVLFKPRRTLEPAARAELVEALRLALEQIPTLRRARIGRRRVHGAPYESLMTADYQYAAVLDFDDLPGLQAYLAHPAHERLAACFFAAFEEALMYDFELGEGSVGLDAVLREGP